MAYDMSAAATLLSQVLINPQYPLNENEKAAIAELVRSCLLSPEKIEHHIKQQNTDIIFLIYCARHNEQIVAIEKIPEALSQFKQHGKINNISIEEYGLIRDIAKLISILDWAAMTNMTQSNSTLKNFHEKVNQCDLLLQAVSNGFKKSLQETKTTTLGMFKTTQRASLSDEFLYLIVIGIQPQQQLRQNLTQG